MATVANAYSGWQGSGGHSYRMRIEVRRTSVNTSANRSEVKVTMWIQSRNSSSFSINSTYSSNFHGSSAIGSTTKNVSITPNGSVKVFEYSKTVTHDSSGNAARTATGSFSNTFTGGTISLSCKLTLDRILQKPSAPSAYPDGRLSNRKFTITSKDASGNGSPILEYQIGRGHSGDGGKNWTGWSWSSGKTYTFTTTLPSGYIYRFQSRARNAAGWGPYSPHRWITIPNDTPDVSDAQLIIDGPGLRLEWSVPSQGSPVGYDIQLQTGSTWGSVISVGNVDTYSWASLGAGTYNAQVRARYSSGATAWVGANSIVLGSVPSAPRTITINSDGAYTWLAPSSLGGHALLGYTYTIQDGYNTLVDNVFTEVAEGSLDNPRPGVGYTISVRAVTERGEGAVLTSARQGFPVCACVT